MPDPLAWVRSVVEIGTRIRDGSSGPNPGPNYIRATSTSGGRLAFVVNGEDASDANAVLRLDPDKVIIGKLGTPIEKHLSNTGNINFPNIPASSTTDITFTFSGVSPGDTVIATPSGSIEAGLVWSAFSSATNKVTIRLANVTVAAIDPVARDWRGDVWKH